MTDRFQLEKADGDRTIVYDNDGIDDYYFTDDDEEMKKLCRHVSKLDRKYRHNLDLVLQAYKSERTALGKSVLKQITDHLEY